MIILNEESVIPLGFTAYDIGMFFIAIDSSNKFSENQIVLKDLQKGTEIDLRETSYQFEVSQTGKFNDRFELVLKKVISSSNQSSGGVNGSDLTTTVEEVEQQDISIEQVNELLNLNSDNELEQLSFYDLQGRRLDFEKLSGKSATYELPSLSAGIYIVVVESAKGKRSKNVFLD